VLLCHPASSGHGLNLQAGGSVIVWFGLSWSLELYQQLNARLHRQGQTKPVRIIKILADTKCDLLVADSLSQKNKTQSSLLEFVERLQGDRK
jgi:SNF2 family DNA or RNA helicase